MDSNGLMVQSQMSALCACSMIAKACKSIFLPLFQYSYLYLPSPEPTRFGITV
ncbi:MAG: hypothetical protein KatS3mg019_0572 [Fimbriimonadales bacterium]|nr:MAG: hypothetical protein KatS3mg019_0572 [Fimbriimonadales bacterium]